MSTKKCTYGQLGSILTDIEKQVKTSAAFEILNDAKIKRFHQQNAMRINVYYKKRKEIAELYVLKDDAGNYQTKEIPDEDPSKPSTTHYDFIDDAHKESFESESKEFLSRTFDLFI